MIKLSKIETIRGIMVRKKFSMFFVLSMVALLCMPEKVHAMGAFKKRYQQCKQNFGWKTAVATGFAGGCTLANYGFALYPFSEGIKVLATSESEFEKAPDVDPIVEQFAREQLKLAGLTNQDSLKIKQTGNWAGKFTNRWAAITTNNYQWIFVSQQDDLKHVLEIKSSNLEDFLKSTITLNFKKCNVTMDCEEYLNEVAGILHHEAGHIINHDRNRRTMAGLATLLATELLSFGFKKKFLRFNNYWIKQAIKIPDGLFKGCLNGLGFSAYSRFIEQQADDNIQDNIEILSAAKRYFKTTLIVNQVHDVGYEKLLHRAFDTHPHHKVEIKRVKKRIKALKEKSNPKAFEDPLAAKEDGQIK